MIRLRTPRIDELEAVSQLCLRSKAVWGYDPAFLAACREELSVSVDDLQSSHVQIAEDETGIAAIAHVVPDEADAELKKLFVDPLRLQRGVGKLLFAWSVQIARAGGAIRLNIDADPEAVGFYRRMGAKDDGWSPSGSIPGRLLPRLVLDL